MGWGQNAVAAVAVGAVVATAVTADGGGDGYRGRGAAQGEGTQAPTAGDHTYNMEGTRTYAAPTLAIQRSTMHTVCCSSSSWLPLGHQGWCNRLASAMTLQDGGGGGGGEGEHDCSPARRLKKVTNATPTATPRTMH